MVGDIDLDEDFDALSPPHVLCFVCALSTTRLIGKLLIGYLDTTKDESDSDDEDEDDETPSYLPST